MKSLALALAVFVLMLATAFTAVFIVRQQPDPVLAPLGETEAREAEAVPEKPMTGKPVGNGVLLMHQWPMKSSAGLGYASVSFLDGGHRVLAAYTDPRTRAREVYAWQTRGGAELYRFFPPGPVLERVIAAPDGKTFLVLFRLDPKSAALRLCEAHTGQEIRTFGHGKTVRYCCADFLADSKHVITGGEDGVLRLWNVATGSLIRELAWRDGPIVQVAISPDGRCVLASTARNARLWDLKTGTTLRAFANARGPAVQAFSPDGKRMLLSSPPLQEVRVIDTSTWADVAQLRGHTDRVHCAAFTPDGKLLVTGANGNWTSQGIMLPGMDRTVRLWETETGRERARWEATAGVTGVAVSADGRNALSGSWDGTLRLWRLPDTNVEPKKSPAPGLSNLSLEGGRQAS